MKNTTRLLVSTALLLSLVSFARAAALDSWSGANTDSDTDHPAVTSGSKSLSATLPAGSTLDAIGDTLTFSGQVTFTFAGTPNTGSGNFRWGLFNSNDSTNNNGWLGYMVGNRPDNSTYLYEKNTGTGSWNATSSDGWTRILTSITGGNSGGVEIAAGSYNLMLSLKREADGLLVNWSLIGTGGVSSYSLIGSWLDTSPVTLAYDRIGISITSNFGQSSATFADLSMVKTSAIPEPSATVLFATLCILLATVVMKRIRHCRQSC
ncbi:hypothetical protein OPIT5_18465 [Opitutaceae bacterium TAV5]|nr:hypothetical protein OPIT5_18465 [Opitutaceae bacterium TAV5]